MTKDLYYCYSPKLKNFLVHKKSIKYLHKGYHEKRENWFWVFSKRDEKLQEALQEWSQNK